MESHRILDMISSPADLKLLTNEEFPYCVWKFASRLLRPRRKRAAMWRRALA